MARELGMNPAKLGKIDNHKQETWKLPRRKRLACRNIQKPPTGVATWARAYPECHRVPGMLRPSFCLRNIKYLLESSRKVFQFFLAGTAKMDGPLVAGSCQTEIASGRFRDFGRFIRRQLRVAESSHLALLPLTSADLANKKHCEALSSLWA